VLLEFPDEAEAYVAHCRGQGVDPSVARVISLEPKVLLWLQQHGVSAVNSLPYFSSAAHARALRKSHQILGWLETNVQLEDGLGIKGAYTNALQWYSRYFIHEMLWICEVLAEAHSQHPNAAIMATAAKPGDNTSPMLLPHERHLASMAQAFCEKQGIPFEPIHLLREASPITQPRRQTGWLGQMAYKLGAVLHRRTLRRMGRHRPLLALTHAYRTDALVAQAKKEAPELPWAVLGERGGSLRGAAFVGRAFQAITAGSDKGNGHTYMGEVWLNVLERTAQENRGFVDELERTLAGLAENAEQQTDLFSHRGVSFAPYYAAKIRSGIGQAMRRMYREVLARDEMLKLLQPRLVMSPFGRRSAHALGDLSTWRGIPGLLISHASFTPTKCDLEEMEWRFHSYGMFHGSYSHAALQTPLAEAFAKQLPSSVQFVPTGPLIWGRVVDRAKSEKLKVGMLAGREHCRVVVHAGTPHKRGSQHFHVYETMDEYVAALADLVSAVDKIPNTFLIIKAKSTPLNKDQLQAMLPSSDNYLISIEEPFLDVLGLSDLLVSLASTTIEEALQNRVPVLLYGGEGRYQHVEAFEIVPDSEVEPRAVYAVSRQEHLADALERVLDLNGKTPLPAELFQQYIYKPEEITPFPQLIRELVGN
jgi:hypothetical protein